MSDVAIRVEGLGKQYRIGAPEGYRTLRDTLTDALAAPFRRLRNGRGGKEESETIWALKDVSFEVKQGEVIGIIGRNGAGKSTLLKILSRITEPTEGHAQIHGRVASLLEVGTGFHPELSGRENIYLNGAILGMKRAEILHKFDEIVAFAEVEKFMDTPVKRYSSGMYLRLAFAVAAHLDPEILIVDEVLAVGDAAFQEKCLGQMGRAARSGRTVLFVSHSMPAIRALTDRTLWIHGGSVRDDAATSFVIHNYLAAFERQSQLETQPVQFYRRGGISAAPVLFDKFWVENSGGCEPLLDLGEAFTLCMEFETAIEIRGAQVSFEIKSSEGNCVTLMLSLDNGFKVFAPRGRHVLRCKIDGLQLAPGRYLVDFGISESSSALSWDMVVNYPLFSVADRRGSISDWTDRPWGSIHCDNLTWSLVQAVTDKPPRAAEIDVRYADGPDTRVSAAR